MSADRAPFELPPGVPAAFTLADAARVLHLSDRTLLMWCRSGAVPGAFQPAAAAGKSGGKWWIPAAEVARLAAVVMLAEPDWWAA